MSKQRSLLFKSLVIPFYRQYAGLLCFVYFIMFLAVESGVAEYHYALIRGMLNSSSFLTMVLIAWLAYAAACSQFFVVTLRNPAFSYLYMLYLVNARKTYWLLLLVQTILFLPVLSYCIIVTGVGYYHHWFWQSNGALLFNVLLCAIFAYRHLYLLQHPAAVPFALRLKVPSALPRKYYVHFLIRYVLEKGKVLFFVIKMYGCGVFYLMMTGRNSPADDMHMVILFFSIGVLGHGMLIHRIKEMENTQLSFIRVLPISITKRFAQYACFYFLLFIPEIGTIASLAPVFLYYKEACFLVLFGYSILLLLNSLQLYHYQGMKDYLKTVMQVLFVIIIATMAKRVHELSVLFFVLSVIIFFRRYYRFEPKQQAL